MQKRCFHSGLVCLGRKTGASAFVAKSRPLSKKQTKRKGVLMKARATAANKQREKTKAQFMEQQIESMDIDKLISETSAALEGAFQDLLLPDGTPRLDTGEVQPGLEPREAVDPYNVLYSLRDNVAKKDLLLSGRVDSNDTKVDGIKSDLATIILDQDIFNAEAPSEYKMSRALSYFASKSKFKELSEAISLSKELGIKNESSTWATIIATCSKKGRHKLAEDYFDTMIESGVEPTMFTWTALVQNIARGKGPDAALEQVDILKRTGVMPTIRMFNTILKSFIDQNRLDDANKLWIRMHLEECSLDKEAFTTMLRTCTKTGTPERAFFYMDEMRALGIEPDDRTFLLLFRSCAEAPHWVDGYHDIIFDAMARMEGAELKPTTEIYSAIIYAFGRGGDTVAAEFYFWEMKRKGLVPNAVTYSSLLHSYALSQTIGAKCYGKSGRYVRPQRAPLTQLEQDREDVGTEKLTKLMSKGITQEFNLDRGSRQKGKLEDLMDDPDVRESVLDNIAVMASGIRAARDGESVQENHPQVTSNVDFEELSRSDPELRKLMDELENDLKKPMKSNHINITPEKLALGSGEDEDEDEDGEDGEDEEDDEWWDEEEEDEENLESDDLSDKQRADRERLIAQMGGQAGDGYEEGEAEYAEWLKKNYVVDVADDTLPLAPDADVSIFSAEDREFLAMKERDQEGSDVAGTEGATGSDGQTRRFITADGLADLMKEIGFDENENELEERKARRLHIRADSNRKLTEAAMRSAHNSLESLENKELKAEKYKRVPYGVSAPSSSFEDPFQDTFSLKDGETLEGIELQGRRKDIVNLLDNEDDAVGDEFDRKVRAPGSKSSLYDSYGDKKRQSYDDDDISPYSLKKEKIKLFSDFTPEDIAHEWDMVEFGRAPNPDYSMTVEDRRAANCERAELVFEDLTKSGIPLDAYILTTHLTVYANAVTKKDKQNYMVKAYEVFDSFKEHDVTPNAVTYRSLIRMHVLNKDINTAIKVKDQMKELGLTPDAESYGWLIRSCGHRDLLVEGLQLLEEVTEKGIVVPERHLKHLRSRCETLGIVHPDMPVDPLQWVTHLKQLRRNGKHRNQRSMNTVKGALFGK